MNRRHCLVALAALAVPLPLAAAPEPSIEVHYDPG
jgi:hypothetical protein